MQATVTTTLVALILGGIAGCGDKSAPKDWWEQAESCPAGTKPIHNRTDIFCARPDGTLHGRYEELGGDGKTVWLAGQYLDNKRHGVWTQFGADGRVLGTYELDRGLGVVVHYRADGSVDREVGVDDATKHGPWIVWHDSKPVKVEEGAHERGKRSGTWVFRDAQNAITKEIDYRDGEMWETREFADGLVTKRTLSEKAKAEPSEPIAVYGGLIDSDPGFGRGYGLRGPRPRVRLRELTSTGGLDKNIARRFVRRFFARYRDCYSRAVDQNSDLEGELTFEIQVSKTGHPSKISFGGIGPKSMWKCFGRVMADTRFPSLRAPAIVRGRFQLDPQ